MPNVLDLFRAELRIVLQSEHWRREMTKHEEAAQESAQRLAAAAEENRVLRQKARALQDKVERQQVRLLHRSLRACTCGTARMPS